MQGFKKMNRKFKVILNMKNPFNFFLKVQEKTKFQKTSFSQSGEDLIVKYIFDNIGIAKPSYIDIGAHHPYYLSNTALFYLSGSRGINIEPDPNLFHLFINERQDDINLNIGISTIESIQDFYIFNVPTLNTFSRDAASEYAKEGNYYIKETKKIKVQTVQNILTQYFNNIFPDFLSLDAEGIDKIIIDSINLQDNFPKVICIETISFSDHGIGVKDFELIDFIKSNNYLHYADTNINSIFVKKEYWIK